MPLYDLRCMECGDVEEVFMSVRTFTNKEDPAHLCACGSYRTSIISPVPAIGIIGVSEYNQQLGVEFRTSRQKEAYLREKGLVVRSTNDASWKRQKERAAEKADSHAIKAGYRDARHHQKEVRKRLGEKNG